LIEMAVLVAAGLVAIRESARGVVHIGLPPVAFGTAMAAVVTLWSNFIVMRNDHIAQARCGHSVLAPCQVTSQIMWVALQGGAITGTIAAAAAW